MVNIFVTSYLDQIAQNDDSIDHKLTAHSMCSMAKNSLEKFDCRNHSYFRELYQQFASKIFSKISHYAHFKTIYYDFFQLFKSNEMCRQ